MKTPIHLDARMIQHTGIGTYLQGLLYGFGQIQTEDLDLKLYGNWENLASYPYAKLKFELPIYSLGEQLGYWNRLRPGSVWHIPHYNVPILKRGARLIVTVHDLIHWIFRKQFFSPLQAFYAETMFRKTAQSADHLIAVSESTKRDLICYFDVDPSRITVIYEAVHPKFLPGDSAAGEKIKRELGLADSFFLYVGSLKPHKNVHRLLKVYRNLKTTRQLRSHLVIVGQKDKKYAPEFFELEALQSSGSVHYFPCLDTRLVSALYQAATALVHPSLYEGFGLTPLEAMASGTPVVCSNAASLPEVVGDAALCFDPFNENEMGAALIKIESDPALHASLKEKGLTRVRQFDWKDTAAETLKIYQKVAS